MKNACLKTISFLKNVFIYFNWRLITLQYCRGFHHISTRISHGCTLAPILNPFPPPSPSHSLSHPSTRALSALSHALNLGWRAVSRTIIHTFQRYSLKSSHPRLLPQSAKDCSLHVSLCCLTYRVIVTILLN